MLPDGVFDSVDDMAKQTSVTGFEARHFFYRGGVVRGGQRGEKDVEKEDEMEEKKGCR